MASYRERYDNVDRNDRRMVRWVCNVRPEDRIPIGELRIKLKLISMRECLQHRRLHWSRHLGRIEDGAWSSKCRNINVCISLPIG